ncbi:MAG: recombinase RecT [Succinivibrio dextrinosolvens]|nr:recombinase RecT [Succinivibrio dextrinosolvens]
MNGNVNNQGQMTLDEMERQLNQPVQSQEQMNTFTENNNGVRNDIKNAVPAQTGYLPLIDLFEPVVLQIKKQFNLSADINDIWLHINHKMFADVPRENLGFISPYNVLEHLYVCIDNNLNPLKPEVASYYVYDYKNNTHSIKTQILLEGYNKIYSTHPQSNGLEYQIYPDVEREFIETEWVTDPQTKKKVKRNKVVKKFVPSRVECRIFRKDMEHPTVGFAFPDDIGNTGAWTGHPSQMMCNRAFTRAVRMAYNLEGTSAEDVVELKDQNISAHQSYNTEQELSYEKTTNGVINNISNCATLIDLNQQVGAYQKVMDKLPAEYRQRILIKIGEMNNLLRKKEHEQKKLVGNNQTSQQNNNNQQNMNQGYDFENQLIS